MRLNESDAPAILGICAAVFGAGRAFDVGDKWTGVAALTVSIILAGITLLRERDHE